jgi:hypothetical protein
MRVDAVRGRLHVQFPVQIGIPVRERFAAHTISRTIRIGTHYKLDMIYFFGKHHFCFPIPGNVISIGLLQLDRHGKAVGLRHALYQPRRTRITRKQIKFWQRNTANETMTMKRFKIGLINTLDANPNQRSKQVYYRFAGVVY